MTRSLTPEQVRLYKSRTRDLAMWQAREHTSQPFAVELKDGHGLLTIDNTVPLTRADCPTARNDAGVRTCGHVKCSAHLWRIDGDDRPGRRGRTPIPTTLRAAWMESPMPPCCALDLAEQGGMAARDIAKVMDKDATLIRMIVRAGAKKLKGYV